MLPPAITDKGQPGPGLLAQGVTDKVLDHLPLQRRQKIYARERVQLPVNTLADGFGQTAAVLSPLAAVLKRDLLTQPVLQADETLLQIPDTQKGKAKKGWLWPYVSAAGSARDIVVYNCRPGRAEGAGTNTGAVWPGAAHPHAAGGAEATMATPVREAANGGVACVADGDGKTGAPGVGLHGAITYALKRWPAPETYLDDGRAVDNNRCEQMMRPVAQGRKSWLFADSLHGGERLAELLTLLHTARLNGLEPVAWLRDVPE